MLQEFHKEERYCLSEQMRRAAIPVLFNIVEACGRHGGFELSRNFKIASGPVSEQEYRMLIARDLECIGEQDHREIAGEINEVKKCLTFLHAS